MNKKVDDRIVAKNEVEVLAKFDLETLFYKLALENLTRAQNAQEGLERVKYSAATIIFAHATVEAYFNWVLQHRMLTHDDSLRRLLGEIISRISKPIFKKWEYVITGVAYLATNERIVESETTKKKARRLSELRNYVVHYNAKPLSTEKLRRTEKGVVVTKAEEMLTPDNAREAVEAAKTLILELHEKEKSSPPDWIRSAS